MFSITLDLGCPARPLRRKGCHVGQVDRAAGTGRSCLADIPPPSGLGQKNLP